jgi:hypothetical protein
MEFLNNHINDNIINVITFLDFNSYTNLLQVSKSPLNNKINDYLCNKKNSTLLDYKKLYYQKYSIGYDKFDLAWKDNPLHWTITTDVNSYIEKYYQLNFVWWFELSYTFTNLQGKYKFKVNINKGDLNKIYYYILINDIIIQEKFTDLSKITPYTNISVETNYVQVKYDDKIKVIFYETNELKNNMKIYCIEYIT